MGSLNPELFIFNQQHMGSTALDDRVLISERTGTTSYGCQIELYNVLQTYLGIDSAAGHAVAPGCPSHCLMFLPSLFCPPPSIVPSQALFLGRPSSSFAVPSPDIIPFAEAEECSYR